jgi:hypothetical protein
MPTLVNCAACGHRRYVPEEVLPFGVRCPKCDETFMDPVVQRVGQPAPTARRRSPRTRHVLVTVLLGLILAVNVVLALVFCVQAIVSMLQAGLLSSLVPWVGLAAAVLYGVNAACAVALLLWRKWGFYGFLATVAIDFVLTLTTGKILAASLTFIAGLAVIGLFYYVLQCGKPSTWSQLD